MEIMLSELQQKSVWDGWLGSEVRANYFGDLCGRYQRLQRVITWATLAASSGATATILRNMDTSVQLTFALATAGLSLWGVVHNYSKSGTDCADLHFRWNKLSIEYETLWHDMYSDESATKLIELRTKEAEIAKSSTSFPNKERLMGKWQDRVASQHGYPATT